MNHELMNFLGKNQGRRVLLVFLGGFAVQGVPVKLRRRVAMLSNSTIFAPDGSTCYRSKMTVYLRRVMAWGNSAGPKRICQPIYPNEIDITTLTPSPPGCITLTVAEEQGHDYRTPGGIVIGFSDNNRITVFEPCTFGGFEIFGIPPAIEDAMGTQPLAPGFPNAAVRLADGSILLLVSNVIGGPIVLVRLIFPGIDVNYTVLQAVDPSRTLYYGDFDCGHIVNSGLTLAQMYELKI